MKQYINGRSISDIVNRKANWLAIIETEIEQLKEAVALIKKEDFAMVENATLVKENEQLKQCMFCDNGTNYVCNKCLKVWEKAEARMMEMNGKLLNRIKTLEGK